MREELQRVSHNVRVIYVMRIFTVSSALIAPNLVLFVGNHGVSQQDFFLLEMLFTVVFAAAQIPTGWFADRYGKRRSMMAGSLLLPVSMSFYAFGSRFIHFASAEAFAAVGVAFISGADEALFYDSLCMLRRSHLHGGLWSRAFVCGFVSMSVGNCLGSYLSQVSPRAPFFAAMVGYGVLCMFVTRLREPKQRKDRNPSGENVVSVPKALKAMWKRVDIRWYVLFSALPMLAMQVSYWTYQNYFLRCSIDAKWHGVLVASFNAWAAVTAFNAARIGEVLGKRFAYIVPMLAIGTGLVWMSVYPSWLVIVVIAVQQSARGFYPGLFSGYFNRILPLGCRATMLSIKSCFELCLATLLLLVARQSVAHSGNVTVALFVLGAIVLTVGLYAAMHRPTDKERDATGSG